MSIDKGTLKRVASVSYDDMGSRPQSLKTTSGNTFNLVAESPTIAIYEGEKKTPDGKWFYLMGVRGTADVNDIRADIELVKNLNSSGRYKSDVKFLRTFFNTHAGPRFVYAIGHSLGGAIIDSLFDERTADGQHLVNRARSYNPAVQPRHLKATNPNHVRVYNPSDFLYNTFGRYLRQKPQMQTEKFGIGHTILRNLPFTAGPTRVYDAFSQHKLENIGAGLEKKEMEEELKREKSKIRREQEIPMEPLEEILKIEEASIPLPGDTTYAEKEYEEVEGSGIQINNMDEIIDDDKLYDMLAQLFRRVNRKRMENKWRFIVRSQNRDSDIIFERVESLFMSPKVARKKRMIRLR